jgi:hypothetical protein
MVGFYFATTSTDSMGIFSEEKFPGFAANRMPKMNIAHERFGQLFRSESQKEYEFVKDVLDIVVRTHTRAVCFLFV